MGKVDELRKGLESVGIGWIEPTDCRNQAGSFMLNHGVKMGVPVDPADVQTMLVNFAILYCGELERRSEIYRKMAKEALDFAPNAANDTTSQGR